MALSRLVDEAGARLEDATKRILALKTREPTLATQHEWLLALSDHAMALAELQQFTHEQVNEGIQELGSKVGAKPFLERR